MDRVRTLVHAVLADAQLECQRLSIHPWTHSHKHHMVPNTSNKTGRPHTNTWEEPLTGTSFTSMFLQLDNKLKPMSPIVFVCYSNKWHFPLQSALSRQRELSSKPRSAQPSMARACGERWRSVAAESKESTSATHYEVSPLDDGSRRRRHLRLPHYRILQRCSAGTNHDASRRPSTFHQLHLFLIPRNVE